jgi:hypothetical protein
VGLVHLLDCFMNCGHSWCIHDSRVSCCQVLPLQGCILIRISATHSNMGDGLLAVSKGSNSTFIMLYLYHEVDVDDLVVDEMIKIKKCLITIACLV